MAGVVVATQARNQALGARPGALAYIQNRAPPKTWVALLALHGLGLDTMVVRSPDEIAELRLERDACVLTQAQADQAAIPAAGCAPRPTG